jgi:quinol monooxygenase YgiN
MSVDGDLTYDTTPYARRRRAEVKGAGGGVLHIRTTPWRTIEAYRALRALAREAQGDPDYLNAVVGVSRPGQVYLLSVWRDRAGTRRMLRSPQVAKLRARFPGLWANEWLPENEFGHWDGLRLRRTRARYAIQMPKAAMDLDRDSVAEPTNVHAQPSQG